MTNNMAVNIILKVVWSILLTKQKFFCSIQLDLVWDGRNSSSLDVSSVLQIVCHCRVFSFIDETS